MAGRLQSLTDAGESSARRIFGEWECGQTMQMSKILTGLMEFALQVLLRDLHIQQAHGDVLVPEQLHEGRKTNSEPDHFGRESVPQPVQCHMVGAAGALGGLV